MKDPLKAVELISETLVRAALRVAFKPAAKLPLSLPALRRGLDVSSKLFPVRGDALVEMTEIAGCPVAIIKPKSATPQATIVHLHGGAFFAGSIKTHLGMAAEMAVRAEATVVLPEYRLAPEHPFPAAIDDCQAVYDALMDQYVDPANTFISGDSAGGGLALSLAQRLRDDGGELPAGIVLISPYLDLSLSGQTIQSKAKLDPMLSIDFLKRGGDAYRGEVACADPLVSPLFGDLGGLPPMLIQCGTDEVLLDDTERLVDALAQAGGVSTCTIYPRMWHDFQMFNLLIGTADKALYEIADFVRR